MTSFTNSHLHINYGIKIYRYSRHINNNVTCEGSKYNAIQLCLMQHIHTA